MIQSSPDRRCAQPPISDISLILSRHVDHYDQKRTSQTIEVYPSTFLASFRCVSNFNATTRPFKIKQNTKSLHLTPNSVGFLPSRARMCQAVDKETQQRSLYRDNFHQGQANRKQCSPRCHSAMMIFPPIQLQQRGTRSPPAPALCTDEGLT